MVKKENIELRLEMAKMHDEVLDSLEKAIDEKNYVTATWLCYACFESRIGRTLNKLSEKCPCRKCQNNNKVGITTRVECVKRCSQNSYRGAENFDTKLLGKIKGWLKTRNIYMHNLVSLENYKNKDIQFKELALDGYNYVTELYKETTMFRKEYYKVNKKKKFDDIVLSKCKLAKNKKEEK